MQDDKTTFPSTYARIDIGLLLDVYARGPARLQIMLNELTDDAMRTYPIPGDWSVAEIAMPLAREVLVATILDSPILGDRIRAMDLAPGAEGEGARLQEVLIHVLHNDPNPTARLQALDVLGRSPLTAAEQDALLTTLRDDASVQIRLRALRVLITHRVDAAVIRRAVSESGQQDAPVMWQLATDMH